MTGKPLVPSNDALRALRSLAYCPSLALIGTAGAFCGVAAIHYNERQKVHRAERILETKRKLHSISKGRGSARLAHMFEAAERGEDFTIRRKKLVQSAQKRRQSALAVNQDDVVTDWKTFHDSQVDTLDTPVGNAADEPMETQQKPAFTKSTVSSSSRDGQTIHEIYQCCNDRSWNRNSLPPSTWSATRFRLGRLMRKRPETASTGVDQVQHVASSALIESTATRQPVTDLNPPYKIVKTSLVETEQVESSINALGSSILLEPSMDCHSADSFFASLQQWQPWGNGDGLTTQEADSPALFADKLQIPDLYTAISEEIPPFEAHHSYSSRFDLKSKRVRDGMDIVGPERYDYVFTSFMNFREKHGKVKALSMLESTMDRYITSGQSADFALAQVLFLDALRLFTTSELGPMIRRLVEKFLQGDAPRLEIVGFLYPRCGAGSRSEEQHYYFFAHQYLELMAGKLDLDDQVTEMRKVVAGTRLLGIQPHEHLFISTLRQLCAASRMTSAQSLLDEMVSVYNVETTTYSMTVLAQGHAKVGNWSKIKEILDEHHSKGFSETKAYAATGLLVSIIDDYALTHSPEKVIEFALHCLREYSLQPVSELTRKIIGLCLRQRRYDLVANWIHILKAKYPHVEVGSDSSTFAFDISCIWAEMDASCDDILNGCKAIASHALRDPFSKTFRLVIADAIRQFFTPRLTELRAELGPDVPGSPTGEVRDFHAALKRLKEKSATRVQGSRARLLLSYLLSQGESLRWINALCRGHLQSTGATIHSITFQEADWSNIREQKPKLPSIAELQISLAEDYARREKSGLDFQHDKLKNLVTQLQQQGRPAHACDLIQAMYNSRWTQPPSGTEFDLYVFMEWLKLAWKLRSGSRLRAVLWALVEADPQLQISGQLLLLARIAAPKTHLQRVKKAKANAVDEVEYLRLRLKRRHWTNSREGGRLSLAQWKGFGNTTESV